jgi:preprotein translocase subunit SecF
MEFFRDTNIQFMKYRKPWMLVSAALIVVAVMATFVHGRLNLGIDFAGGTQLTLKFRTLPEVEQLRVIVAAAGVSESQIQSFGSAGENEILIKTPSLPDSEEGSRDVVIAALESEFGAEPGRLDLNRNGRDAITEFLVRRDPDGLLGPGGDAAREGYERVADAILAIRREEGLIREWEEVATLPEVTPEAARLLQEDAALGEFAVLGAENVGPQIGSELTRKGILAIVSSLIGMLVYIWFRFELRFGIGALVAVVHDVLVVLGLYALADFEFNVTTIAGFLTLVGYSVNDSVVVFDRVRENLRRNRTAPLEQTMNLSINQTLSRTVLTSGTTLLAVGSLLFLGGDVLRGFAFILTVGVVVGTYSSIYVASPFALHWEQIFGRAAWLRRREAKAGSA